MDDAFLLQLRVFIALVKSAFPFSDRKVSEFLHRGEGFPRALHMYIAHEWFVNVGRVYVVLGLCSWQFNVSCHHRRSSVSDRRMGSVES